MLLPALDAAGARASLQPYAVDRKFLEKLGPEALATWHDLLTRDAGDGVHVAFHPPVGWDGYRFLRNARAQNPRASAHVGYTMFETDRLPSKWAEELSEMDEVWVPCRFNLETFARAGVPESKLKLFQPGLDLEPFMHDVEPHPIAGRAAFTFLSVFQWTRRKGWDVLLEAFVRAFTRADDVRLVIRAYPGERKDPPIRERVAQHLRVLGLDPANAPDIVVIDEFVTEAQLPSLYAAADAYVLPTRGEGFGLPFLEAMAAGLPTIGTNWGGQLDFLDDDVGYLIDVDGLQPVDAEQTAENPYYEADHRWAMPSVAHTAALMRRVFEERDEAARRGARAKERVFAHWSAAAGARRFVDLARDLHARAPQSGPRTRSLPATSPVLWQGPLLGISGYADEGRDLVAGLDDLGVRLRIIAELWGENAPLDPVDIERLERLSSMTLFEPPVAVAHGFGGAAKRLESARATVCRTMFETDRAPASWVEPLNKMDEVWVPGRFQVEAFARAGVERSKLHVVHGTLDARRYATLPPPLAVEGRRSFNFLSVFDWSVRKGWDVLLRAWVEAFAPRDEVALILKVHSTLGLTSNDIRARIRAFVRDACGRDPDAIPPVLLVTSRTSRDEMTRLFTAADAYVMPSRGEGWGRPFVEAMACGLPVIATHFGSSLEFLDEETAFLADAREVEVPPEAVAEQPLFAGHRWGEPSVDHVTELLQRVRRDPRRARAVGAVARERVLARFDRGVVARTIQARLLELGAPRRSQA
jgi:glycosyltransferase involved in cell wall biosynthesis